MVTLSSSTSDDASTTTQAQKITQLLTSAYANEQQGILSLLV